MKTFREQPFMRTWRALQRMKMTDIARSALECGGMTPR